MPDRCAVASCPNIPEAENGIALQKFHFMVTFQVKRRPEGKIGRTENGIHINNSHLHLHPHVPALGKVPF